MWTLEELAPEMLMMLLYGDLPGWTLMQSTGLVGKDGVLVFEGDIVEAWSQGACATFEVVWRQEGHPCLILWPAWQNGDFWHMHGSRVGERDGRWHDDLRVLGNVFENPDLRPARAGLTQNVIGPEVNS
jgi:uncharacterized phage protein (TIGR01671 family)